MSPEEWVSRRRQAELRRQNSTAWRHQSKGRERANGEEGVGFKMDKVGGRGVRHNAGNRRGVVRPFRPLMASTGEEETMTSA